MQQLKWQSEKPFPFSIPVSCLKWDDWDPGMMYLFYTLHLTTRTYAKLEIHTLPAKLSPCCVWSHFKLGLLGNLHLLRNLVVSWYVTARGSTLPLCSKLFISASSDVSFHCQTTTPGPSTCWGRGKDWNQSSCNERSACFLGCRWSFAWLQQTIKTCNNVCQAHSNPDQWCICGQVLAARCSKVGTLTNNSKGNTDNIYALFMEFANLAPSL